MAENSGFLVVDTSIAGKWFFKEPDWEKADKLRDQIVQRRWQPVVPAIFRCELSHIFWKRRGPECGVYEAREAVKSLDALNFRDISISDLLPKYLEIAFHWEITVYDALYVALAQSVQGPVATFDKNLSKKIRAHKEVHLLDLSEI